MKRSCLIAWVMLAMTAAMPSLKAQEFHDVTPGSSLQDVLDAFKGKKGSVEIRLRGGVYRINKPLRIGPEQSNDSLCLTLRAYPGEHPVLTSSIRLEPKWRRWKGGIRKARIGDVPVMDVLLAGGSFRPMARYPDYDSLATRFNGTSADATSPSRIASWANPEGGYLHAMHAHDWGDFHYRILGKDEAGELILEGGWQNNRPMGLHPDNRMVENIFEELDAPGEWYYDRKEGVLYYYPLQGEVLEGQCLESPQAESLLVLEGTREHPVKNVRIEGIRFCGTRRTFMDEYEPLLRSDWTIHRGAAVVFRGTESCTLSGCVLDHLGGNGVFFDGWNRSSGVEDSELADIGASGILFVGETSCVRSPSFGYENSVPYSEMDREKGPRDDRYPSECFSSGNLIHRIGLWEKQVAGVGISVAHRILVSHNTIHNTPRAGINIGDGAFGGHVIEYNDVFDTVRETGDHGSFNSWGRDRYWRAEYDQMAEMAAKEPSLILADMLEPNTLRYNRFRCDRGWDIDLDDGSSNYLIIGNLCLSGGIKLREGWYRRVENNIMVNNTLHPHVWFAESGDVFTRNIVMEPYKPVGTFHENAVIDYNIFAQEAALEAARAGGHDSHSIACQLEFEDPMRGDYTLPDDSPAITRGGFRNLPMDGFGVRAQWLKERAGKVRMSLPVSAGQANDGSSELWTWKGATFKSLETLGERSATGMDSERGVYVVGIEALGSPLRDCLRSGDVILRAGGKEVSDLSDFKSAIAAGAKELVIFRQQHEVTVTLP